MGVSWVFETEMSAKAAERTVETGGGVHNGTFTVDCLPYIPHERFIDKIQTNYVLHHSKYPQSTFSIAPSDNFKSSPRALCDRGFDLILNKMSSGCVPDPLGKFELTGNEYQVRDFVVRVGTAVQVTAVKGVVVEVEYEPCSVVTMSLPMLTEFMELFYKKYSTTKPDVLEKGQGEQYTALDTMWQYLTIFRAFRKRA